MQGRKYKGPLAKQPYKRPILGFVPNTIGVQALELMELPDDRMRTLVQQGYAADDERVYRANPDVVTRQIGDEWVLVPTGELAELSNGMITLNTFSYFLWQQFQQPASQGSVLAAAKAEYDDPQGLMETEVRNFVRYGYYTRLLLEEK